MRIYVHVKYQFSDGNLWDIAAFDFPVNPHIIPDTEPPIPSTEAELCNAIDDAMEIIDEDEFDDEFERFDAIFDAVAERMGGSWEYVRIAKYIEG